LDLLDHTVNELLDLIGRSSPQVSGSTAALLTSEFGIAMCKMALLVSSGDGACRGAIAGYRTVDEARITFEVAAAGARKHFDSRRHY
jgi:hypothetical protein